MDYTEMTVLVTKRNAVVESVIVYQSTHTVYPKCIVMSKDFYILIDNGRKLNTNCTLVVFTHTKKLYDIIIHRSFTLLSYLFIAFFFEVKFSCSCYGYRVIMPSSASHHTMFWQTYFPHHFRTPFTSLPFSLLVFGKLNFFEWLVCMPHI